MRHQSQPDRCLSLCMAHAKKESWVRGRPRYRGRGGRVCGGEGWLGRVQGQEAAVGRNCRSKRRLGCGVAVGERGWVESGECSQAAQLSAWNNGLCGSLFEAAHRARSSSPRRPLSPATVQHSDSGWLCISSSSSSGSACAGLSRASVFLMIAASVRLSPGPIRLPSLQPASLSSLSTTTTVPPPSPAAPHAASKTSLCAGRASSDDRLHQNSSQDAPR